MGGPIVVIGGGAAGLMAAGRAAELGARVLLLEKTARLGSKLRLTGNGRCNLTHTADDARAFLAHVPRNGSFLRNGLARFGVAETLTFFAALGVPTVTEADGRVFPASHKALDVVTALTHYATEHGVEVRTETAVERLYVRAGAISGLRTRGGALIEAQRVILATGGLSYPQTGSTGDGYRLAEEVGHTLLPLRPGLVPLVTAEEFVPRLQGVSLRDVRLTVYQGDQRLASQRGEMLFTHYGVSGPAVLSASLSMAEALAVGPLRLSMDLIPAEDAAQLDQRLRRNLAALGNMSYYDLVKGFVPRALAEVLVELSGIARAQSLSQFTTAQRGRLRHLLKHLDVTVVATRPLSEATVTLGGVCVQEVDPRTLASRRVQGLCFAGEVLDVTGDTGGYNLQIAFTSGRLAGESARMDCEG